MSSFGKVVILCSAAVKICVVVCVTALAMHFDKPSLCWWYLLVCFVGWEVKTTKTED